MIFRVTVVRIANALLYFLYYPLTKTSICLKYGIDKRLDTVCNIYVYSIIPRMSFSFFCNLLNSKQQPQTLDLPLSLCPFSDFLTYFVTSFETKRRLLSFLKFARECVLFLYFF